MYKTTTDKKRTRKSHLEAANKLLAFSCQTLAWRLDCTTLKYNHHRTRRTIAASKESSVYSNKNNTLKSEMHNVISLSVFFCTNCCVSFTNLIYVINIRIQTMCFMIRDLVTSSIYAQESGTASKMYDTGH